MRSLEIIHNHLTQPIDDIGYNVRRGWNHTIADELVALSHQPHILEFTPGDAHRRFPSVEAAQEWHDAHERVIYTVGREAVAGLIWFGKTESTHGDYTFAIRMYEELQGKRLAQPFMQAAHNDFYKKHPDAGTIWLDTRADNQRAISLYEKVGYQSSDIIDDRIVMTRTPE